MTPAGACALGPGLHHDVATEDYLEIDAIGSTRLEWMAVSPKHYRYMIDAPRPKDTAAQALGTALHMAALEPTEFGASYAEEPDPDAIAPGSAKPRATAAYRAAVAVLEDRGTKVLRLDDMGQVLAMRDAIHAHVHAAQLLTRAPQREVTAIWERDGLLCRARFDMLGSGVLGDIKTTRRIKDFSPWVLTRLGYYRQAAWYRDGARRLGLDAERFYFIAVENTPPYDVGVFALEDDVLDVGTIECDALFSRIRECGKKEEWPGMYPDVQIARLTDAIALQMPELEQED